MGCGSSMELDPEDMHVFGFVRHAKRTISDWRDARVFHRHACRLRTEMEGLRSEIGECDAIIRSLTKNTLETERMIRGHVAKGDREIAVTFSKSKGKVLASLTTQVENRDMLQTMACQLLSETVNSKIIHRSKRISGMPIVTLSESVFQRIIAKLTMRTVVIEDQHEKIQEMGEAVNPIKEEVESDEKIWERLCDLKHAPSVPESEPDHPVQLRQRPGGSYL